MRISSLEQASTVRSDEKQDDRSVTWGWTTSRPDRFLCPSCLFSTLDTQRSLSVVQFLRPPYLHECGIALKAFVVDAPHDKAGGQTKQAHIRACLRTNMASTPPSPPHRSFFLLSPFQHVPLSQPPQRRSLPPPARSYTSHI